MKGFEISLFAYFLIAIVSISLLIIYIGTNTPQSLKGVYCSFSLGLSGILPFPESMKPPIPSYCKGGVNPETVVTLESSDADFVQGRLLNMF